MLSVPELFNAQRQQMRADRYPTVYAPPQTGRVKSCADRCRPLVMCARANHPPQVIAAARSRHQGRPAG